MPGEELYLMSPTEICWGYLIGHEDPPTSPGRSQDTPRDALEAVVRVALGQPPCGVAFSGGRDSSLVLAVATHVARRDGLPEPIPITRRFPNVAATDETRWQELVIRHLGLAEWERVDFNDELDVVGPLAARHLTEHGVVWPPTIAGDIPFMEAVAGGTILDGEGGDEVLGIEAHRIAPLTRLVREPRRANRWWVRHAMKALAPARIRVPRVRRERIASAPAWLLPDAWKEFMDALDVVEADQPLSFSASVRRVPRRRSQVLLARNRNVLAARRNVVMTSPLLDSEFVSAIAADGRALGRGDRTVVLRSIAADLLPDALIARTTKSTFTSAYMGAPTRAFAQSWDGRGLDDSMVDPEVLRGLWMSPRPPAPTASLLQSAWLAAQ